MRSEGQAAGPLVDFHLHTTASDGRKTPEQVVAQAVATGLCRMAVTDHDTVAGVAPARRAAAGHIPLVPGIEFTCREEVLTPGVSPFSIHLLGYGIDTEFPALTAALEARAAAVRRAYQTLLDRLAAGGCPLRYEDIPARCGPNHLELADIDRAVQAARPDAPALRALVANHATVMDRQNIPVKQAMDLIHAAGGVAVWAHPFHVYQRFAKQRLEISQVKACLQQLRPFGLDGLEAYYRAFSEDDRAVLDTLARENGLLCTAGSDCHGIPPRDLMGVTIPADRWAELQRQPAFSCT